MNPRLEAGLTAPPALEHIAMSIGEPQHAPPQFLLETERIRDFLRAPPATVRNSGA
jgi:hypothetical protein